MLQAGPIAGPVSEPARYSAFLPRRISCEGLGSNFLDISSTCHEWGCA